MESTVLLANSQLRLLMFMNLYDIPKCADDLFVFQDMFGLVVYRQTLQCWKNARRKYCVNSVRRKTEDGMLR